MPREDGSWIPFRPDADDLKTIAEDVSEVGGIQQTLLDKSSELRCPDRVAHQYQIAGGRVTFRVAAELPAPLPGVGLFQPNAEHIGVGRISTGLGIPHVEAEPDFLGMMLAFETRDGHRVDFLLLNDPAAPTDNHQDFMTVLHATGQSAGARVPLLGKWGEHEHLNFLAQQTVFVEALKDRMGWIKAGTTMAHLTKQTIRTTFSSTAYQAYWSGIAEVSETAGKFTLVPTRDENASLALHPGKHHLSEEWRGRQRSGDTEFTLYWIPFLDEEKTPARLLTRPWEESHKQAVGTIRFPKTDSDADDARLWAILASEMGANHGNWVHNPANSINEPATIFGAARKLAYQKSQAGRGALLPEQYRSVFSTG